MFNAKMFVEGFKLTLIPTFAIAMLAIACQFMAWEIGYLPAMLILIPGCYAWYRWTTVKRSKKLVEKILHESEEEG